ncbi:hypothetical protein LNV08_11840 [Paucibacter sp. TC2R-5]|uniref:hypothetical protein n=1 Tax=Paucibacter sp. TC2R-5 TaxID=2893555 RepID=UPI0021E4E291|nr:hypothetical protein [Paucibacter sp. TC2R-5]MCV2359661.1 hypothetical protein [Paucibacter sp. TC2R-5]
MTDALIRAKPAVARMTVACKRGRGKPPAKKSSGLRERAWWVMRQKGQFTRDDLLTTLADGTYKDAPSNLQKYITALERVGVLARLKRRAPGNTLTSNGHVIWRVARDLGRAAPVWRPKQQELLDPNSGALLRPPGSPAADDRTLNNPDQQETPA